MVKIRKYDEMLKKLYEELNDDIVNKYNEDTSVPLMFLQEKYFAIAKAPAISFILSKILKCFEILSYNFVNILANS